LDDRHGPAEAEADLRASWDEAEERSTALIMHLPSREVTDDDSCQAAQRLPLHLFWHHRPQAAQFDRFGRRFARGGTLTGS
jgi:hypothetical protein